MSAAVRFVSLTLFTAAAFATVSAAQIQRRPAGQQKPTVKIETSLQVGSGRHVSAATGQCEYAPTASIFGVLSEMYRVEQRDDKGSVTLTLWKPKDGSSAMMNLSVGASGAQEEVQTVKGQPSRGSGTITVDKAAAGGTFRIDAKSQKGLAVTGTIACSAFTPAIAEGGH